MALSLVYMAGLEAKQRNFNGRKDDWIFAEHKPKLCSAEKGKGVLFSRLQKQARSQINFF